MRKIMLLLLLITSSCSSVNIVGVDKAPDFTITKYKSFNFYEVNMGGDALGPDTDGKLKLLKEAISKQLSLKGLSQTTENPDLLINIGVLVDEKTQTRQTDFSNPADRTAYMNQRNYSWHSQEVEVGKYRQGTVTVHLVDRTTNKLVWKGSADSVLPAKEKNIPALIEEGMAKLFEKVE